MPRDSVILSVSLPAKLSAAIDKVTKRTHQNRSEFIRAALREHLLDHEEERLIFEAAYKATRKEKSISSDALRKKYGL